MLIVVVDILATVRSNKIHGMADLVLVAMVVLLLDAGFTVVLPLWHRDGS